MKNVIVLGIGNRLMGDDGIGVRIVEALGQGKILDNVRFAVGETDIDYSLNELFDEDICVIVDASRSGRDPCSVGVFDLKEVFKQRRSALSFHDFDLIHAMKRANMFKDGLLITVEICSAGFSPELSPLMRERFEEIVREVRVIIGSYLLARGLQSRLLAKL